MNEIKRDINSFNRESAFSKEIGKMSRVLSKYTEI
jgi:hypothetical protein